MPLISTLLAAEVVPDWIDNNGHMGDFAYAVAFTRASDKLMELVGIDEDYLKASGCTIFTLEIHITYLKELFQGDKLFISGQILDYDHRRVHAILEMTNSDGHTAAYYEVISMHMCIHEGQVRAPADFSEPVYRVLQQLGEDHRRYPPPKYVGSKIGI